ncbi:DUF6415 family natural product biosynthesis protein [Streptomyces lunalinharesii]|uniref:DUF6415 family natural product biosynthesis protein n=1 Tax=Streptomyces lunalinharesii TaxID=333384 RepID=UPI003CD07789
MTAWRELLTGHAQLLIDDVRARSQREGHYAEAAAACIRCTTESLTTATSTDPQAAYAQTQQLARAVAALLGFAIEADIAEPEHHNDPHASAWQRTARC